MPPPLPESSAAANSFFAGWSVPWSDCPEQDARHTKLHNNRRPRTLGFQDILDHPDAYRAVLTFLDLASIVRVGLINRATYAMCLTRVVEEVALDTMGVGRHALLRQLSQGGFTGLRRFTLEGGINEEDYVALFSAIRSGLCPLLQSLNMSKGNLTDPRLEALSESLMDGCPLLEELDISQNPVTDAGMAIFAQRFVAVHANLRTLRALRLRIKASGLAALCRALQPVSPLDTDHRKPLPPSRVTTLELSMAAQTVSELHPLLHVLHTGRMHSMVRLNLSGTALRDSGMELLSSALVNGQCSQLRELLLANVNMTSQGLLALARALPTACPDLRTLRLDSNNLGSGPSSLSGLAHAMRQRGLENLEALYLKESGLSSEAIAPLMSALQQGACVRLTSLDLSSNILGDGGAAAVAAGFMSESRKLSCTRTRIQLQKLDLTDCGIASVGMVVLGSALPCGAFESLRTLEIGDRTGPGASGLLTIAEALHTGCCPVLEVLSLYTLKEGLDDGDDRATSTAAVKLAEAISGRLVETLRELRLQHVSIGATEGATAMARALCCCKALRVVVLDDVGLGQQGTSALSGAIAHNACSQLVELSLANNKAGDRGISVLASALCMRHSHRLPMLRILSLAGNDMTKTGASKLAAAFRAGACRRLVRLDCDDNPLGDAGIDALMQAFVPQAPPSQQQQQTQSSRMGGLWGVGRKRAKVDDGRGVDTCVRRAPPGADDLPIGGQSVLSSMYAFGVNVLSKVFGPKRR